MAPAIEVFDITKKFGDLTAVDRLSLKIKTGEVFGFLGPNGAGKTTSIRMMTGLLKPTSGKVLIEGEEIEAVSERVKRNIGLSPQDIVVWDLLTTRENLLLVADMYGVARQVSAPRATELLEAMNLTEKRDVVAKNLSGGMKRRLNLAMALIHDPETIVLDEPITGLDPQSRLMVSDYIRSLGEDEGKTIILTTHLMEIAEQMSDRVAIIDHGKLLVLDTPDQLKKTVGKGDVVEISLEDEGKNLQTIQMLEKMDGMEEVNEIRGNITLRALNALNMLPAIISSLQGMKADILNLSLRSNSLENVFITLTGRGLRE
ncbi:MAG: ATP-binding cassette domain-containing protein [Candidatus Thermoplasmatota archaeon]|nr:ATP-binding cassette domain-containing protein [Candidatus Thermoplasmatota archaeon]